MGSINNTPIKQRSVNLQMNNNQIPGIIFDRVNAPHPRVDSDNASFYLEYDKTEEYFSYFDNEVAFYKGCEDLVRAHDFYRITYPKYLKEVVGLTTCQIFPGIEDNDRKKVSIEMHHFPLTLFDICEIVTKYLRVQRYEHITTPYVANIVIEEHRQNRCRIVKVSKSAHQKIHNDDVYINYRQGFGDTLEFLDLYKAGVDKRMRTKINEYIAWSLEHDSTDNNIFVLSEVMRKWGNNDFDSSEQFFSE